MKSLINEELIVLELEATSQREVIEHLARLLKEQNRIASKEFFVQGVIDRENEFTTGFGNGIAIPHCKIDSVKKASIAIAKTKEGIKWNSMDGLDVNFVIMLAIPIEESGSTHLRILSTLSGKLMDDDFRHRLMNANENKDIIQLLEECVSSKIN